MATPNIVNVTTINGLTTFVAVTSAGAILLANSSGSGTVLKINTLFISNIDGVNACDVSVAINTSAGGAGTSWRLCNTISVPADASLVVIDKNSQIYLNEDRSIIVTSSTASDLEAIVSYELIASG